MELKPAKPSLEEVEKQKNILSVVGVFSFSLCWMMGSVNSYANICYKIKSHFIKSSITNFEIILLNIRTGTEKPKAGFQQQAAEIQ